MHKLLFFILFIPAFGLFAQKNRFESFFKEVSQIQDKNSAIKKLEEFRSKNDFNKLEKIRYFELYIPLTIENQNYDLALKSGFEALNFAKQIKNDSLITSYTNQIGGTYYYLGNKIKALNYFQEAAERAKEDKNWTFEAMTRSNIGAISIEIHDYKTAEKSIKEAISIFKKHKIDKSKGLLSYRLLATLYTQKGEFHRAEPIYLELISLSKQLKDTIMISSSLIYYGEFLASQNKIKQAIQKCEEALSYKTTDKGTYFNILSLQTSYFLKAGLYKEASFNYKKMLELNKNLFQDNLGKNIAETEVKYKTLEMQRQKDLAEAKTKEEQRKNQLYLFVFVGIILLLIIVSLVIYLKLQAKRKRIELAIQKHHLEAILKAQEEEKVRIARDLHDGICQKFAAAKMRFSAFSDGLLDNTPDLKLDYKNCISLLDEATNELRSIAHEIMPPSLNELGLVEALRLLANQSFNNNINFTFEVFGEREKLEQNDEINLYRIAQELFLNVLKHANASEVAIQILFSKKQISLFVEDNGKGFLEKNKTGMGLSNINIRCEMIKAKFNIEPGANGGTIVSIIKVIKI